MYMNASDLTEFTNNGQPYLPPFQTMRPGSYLESPDKSYRLVMQSDVNLCLWKGGDFVWAANGDTPNTKEAYGKSSTLQYWPTQNCAVAFGGLHVVDNMRGRTWDTVNSYEPWDPINYRRGYAVVQDDGNVVVNRYTELFMSDPGNLMYPDDPSVILLAPGHTVARGTTMRAGGFTYTFQEDSNFVIYNNAGTPIWNSQTYGANADRIVMQEDGNLVMYRGYDAVWHTSTGGNAGAYAALQSNGNLVVFRTQLMWARFGFTPTTAPRGKNFKRGSNLGTAVNQGSKDDQFFKSWSWAF